MNIYQVEDYREILGQLYEAAKEKSGLTTREMAAEIGFSNPGYINDVIKGRRRLSKNASEKIAKYFSLRKSEAEYFKLLVEYSGSKKTREKEKLYKRIMFRRNRSRFAQMNPAMARYYQDYRYPLVRAAIMSCDFRGDFEKLSKFIHPSIPPVNLRKFVNNLIEWDIVSVDKDGKYRVSKKFITPSPELSQQVRQTQREWINQSKQALDEFERNERHISSMLLSLSGEGEERVNKLIEEFRNRIWETVEEDRENADRVRLLNIQFFPKSKRIDNND